MQDLNNQPLLRGKTKTLLEHVQYISGAHCFEFVLYGDNILECFSLLHPAVEQKDIWDFEYVVFEPVDQPIYVFKSLEGAVIAIKACGLYTNWLLPGPVSELINRYDLPDFVLFNASTQQVVFAGELTETASVGNSQWQRELRKIAAAELGVPFIYRTVYSEKDDSQGTIREPTALLAYNAFAYSIRYRVTSLVLMIEPNIESSASRVREESLNDSWLARLFCGYILEEIGENTSLRLGIEKDIYLSMAKYLQEVKHVDVGRGSGQPRLVLDLPCLNPTVKAALLDDAEAFVSDLAKYLHDSPEQAALDFRRKFDFGMFIKPLMCPWTSARKKEFIRDLFNHLESNQLSMPVAPRPKFAIGVLETSSVISFLKGLGPVLLPETEKILSAYDETVLIPIIFHKKVNGKLQFTKDPYAGNTAAFSELFGYGPDGTKRRAIVTYCVSQNPENFDIHSKRETNIYKSVAKYSDVLVIDSNVIVTRFEPSLRTYETQDVQDISCIEPRGLTEDMGVVSTFLQMGCVASDWDVSLIAIHHSSWQQVRIRDKSGLLDTAKIGRNDSKVDLVMQSSEGDLFLIAEGKTRYEDFFKSTAEESKIESAFINARGMIDQLYKVERVAKIAAFICLLDVSDVDISLSSEKQKIQNSVMSGRLDRLANQEFVVIGVFTRDFRTHFELFFSRHFDIEIMETLKKIFSK